MAGKKPRVSTKYSSARQKEEKIIQYLRENDSRAYPKEISSSIRENQNTVKSILKRLERKGIVKVIENTRGLYALVENNPHSLLSWNFHNLIIFYRIKNFQLKDDYSETFSLDDFVKFDLKILSRSIK